MIEWSTYRLEDFLLFSPRVYWRLFELHNADVWPLQIPALALGLLSFWLILHPRRGSDRVIATVLATAWINAGWFFLWQRYGTINWTMAYIAPAFFVQALLLLIFGTVTGHLRFRARQRLPEMTGLALFFYALLCHPFAAVLSGRPFAAAEIVGIAPDPTAIATLGIVLTAWTSRLIWLLMPIPVIWCLLSALTLLAMEARDAWIPLAAVALALLSCIGPFLVQRRGRRPTTSDKRPSPALEKTDRHSRAPTP